MPSLPILRPLSPGLRLAAVLPLGLGVIALMLLLSLRLPWLGLELRWDADRQAAVVLRSTGPSLAIAPGSALVSVSDGIREHRFSAIDFTIEPDGNLPTYDDYRAFLTAQDQLARVLAGERVVLRDIHGVGHEVTPASGRPVISLPTDFWVQLVVGFFAWVIAAGVWAFRPADLAVRYLLISGFATLLFAPAAAVYTTRELAVDLAPLLLLKTFNFGGGLLYSGAMVALLWVYPRRLGPTWIAAAIVIAYIGWFAAQALGAFDSMLVGRRWPVFVALLGTVVLSVAQWIGTRRDPLARASLQWFLLSWLVGAGVFVILTMVPQVYGVDTAAIQGYSFLLFLLVYGGLAFGILRFRLFELGQWWFRALTWILGGLLLVALDLLLLLGLHFSPQISLSLALLICAFVWLPLRGWLWLRLSSREAVGDQDLFKSVLQVALAPSREQHVLAWEALLRRLFSPLRIEALQSSPAMPQPEQDGLAMLLPATERSPALRLGYPGQGRRLFTPRDVALCAQLIDMLRYAENRRDAYNQGALAERGRIARDLHDDIGSLLLSGLHQAQIEQAKNAISRAMTEMQTIIRGLAGTRLSLETVIADIRHELGGRLDAAGIVLDWPLPYAGAESAGADNLPPIDLDYPVYKNLVSIMRELIANIIRHAGARHVGIQLVVENGSLIGRIIDDGDGFDGEASGGHGLGNLRRRLAELGGSIDYRRVATGTQTRVQIPLFHAAVISA